jgi:hypothetical protein
MPPINTTIPLESNAENPGTEVDFLFFPVPFGFRSLSGDSFSGFVADLEVTGLQPVGY